MTRNNTLMAYVGLEDDTGDIELLLFQRCIDAWGGMPAEGTPIMVRGKISQRDETKPPQIVVDELYNIRNQIRSQMPEVRRQSPIDKTRSNPEQSVYLRFASESDPAYEHFKLCLVMFPGNNEFKVYFEDTKRLLSVRALRHPALLQEMSERLGVANVVLK